MKISLNWLKDYIALDESPEKISETLTATGLEVEGLETYEQVKGNLEGVVIGEVLTCEKHPDADKLSVTTVDIGVDEPSQIVCGAPNVATGQKVVVATVNSTLYPGGGEPFKIKKAKIRGVVSMGMICAEDELGLGTSHDGIMVLDTDLANGTPATQYFNLENDHVFEIGLTPNRADGASHFGTARDLKAAFRRPLTEPDISAFAVDNTSKTIEVVVENYEACPRFTGVTISGLEVKASPDWLQHRLKSIGLTPINNVVDSTNYVLHSLGQPLHAYDCDEITGDKIVVKTMAKDTPFVTLDEVERKLADKDLMVCNAEEGMCIAGVFGGIKSGVKDSTTSIFLEAAYFSPDYVRKTSMLHGLKTDASFRFERGADPNMTLTALKICTLLIKELAGGEISSEVVDIYLKPLEDFSVSVKYQNVDRLIGKQIPHDRIKEILGDLDIKVSNETSEEFDCTVPAYRVDVQREADVVEEILRIYGYNNIELEENYGTDFLANFPTSDKDKIQQQITLSLSSIGFNEIITNSLTNPEYADKSGYINSEENVVILNKLSEELGVMRQSLIFSGLESVRYNINRKQKNLKFFEFGRTYKFKDSNYSDQTHLSLFLSGNNNDESWRAANAEVQFHDLSSAVYKILSRFNIDKLDSVPTDNPAFEYGLDISANTNALVSLGRLSKKITAIVDVRQAVYYAEINWDALVKFSGKKLLYKAVPKFPEVRRDLSLVIDKSVTFDDIKKLAQVENKKLIKRINVFSVYEGENIGENKKSYALSFILQDEFKTLNDKQIDKVMSALIRSFEQNINAIIRK
ncbi:MAG: phenylalanine--tRNA ligase subunit beta [Cyclobacteriaceae bacterium]